MKPPLLILILEDNPDDADMLLEELRKSGFDPRWKRVQTEEGFLAELASPPDLILSDYSMPSFSGLRAVELLRERGLDTPFILVSGTLGEDAAVEAMKRGATDFLLKDRISRLGPAVGQALDQSRARKERKRMDEELQTQLTELQRWHKATLGREQRILELKREVNELLTELGKSRRYATADES